MTTSQLASLTGHFHQSKGEGWPNSFTNMPKDGAISESPARGSGNHSISKITICKGVDKATDWAAEQGNKAVNALGQACGQANCVGEFQRMRPDQMNQSAQS